MEYPRAVPLALFSLIVMITVLSVYVMERGEAQRIDALLSARAKAVSSALERRANANSSYLRAGSALFSTLDEVPRAQFERFVGELRLDADYRGAEGFGWAPVVPRAQLGRWSAAREAEGGQPTEIFPVPPSEQTISVPVTFLQPDTERNRRALGFDMYSQAVRREAMQKSFENLRPTASGAIVLVQDVAQPEPGFVIYMPVVVRNASGSMLRGFVYSPFNAADFLTSALELEAASDVGVRFYDVMDGRNTLLASVGADAEGARTMRETIDIANHRWLVEIVSPQTQALSSLSVLTLLFGLMVALLLMMVVRLLTQQAYEDDAALTWFAEQASIRNSLTRELNHRVKNTLANVLSIVALTRRRANTLNEFADGIDGRIRALSATHDLLTQSDWGTTPVRAVVEAELAPYARGSESILDLKGPDVELAPNDALSLGLAIHELATNAAKYGALSAPSGKVEIVWQASGPKTVEINWQESGGPTVVAERTRGFGTDLIEKIVAHELGNPVELDFNPDGVRCKLLVPVRQPTDFALRARSQMRNEILS